MIPEYSLAYLTVLGLSPPRMVAAAAKAGYSYVGLRLHAVTTDEPRYPLHLNRSMLLETKHELAATGVRVLDVELIRLTPWFDVHEHDALLDVSAELGARHLIAQGADANLDRVIDHFGQLCDAAAKRKLTADIEFVTWTETADLARAAAIVGAAARDNGGLLIDTLHFSRSHDDIAELAKLPRHWFHYAQVCDAPSEPPKTLDGLIFAARNERMFPGAGGLDLPGILGALPAGIPYSLEIPTAALAKKVGLEECARLALESAKDFFAAAGGRPLTSASASRNRLHH
ncbi:sugar phosphate isomerase/epimerase family protein [Steroidobacter sp.]|uniref:sugar phosphate isomerase/epimerase family protein n=1 Tax=Steroidobacter sp. TaxID=1978227 RepID=UPI001A3B994F|nr:TIM barrel protein [Steroidobacter sp.]MBL8271670.1 TIM barrel protein [Steroidobacter sp.]